MTKICVNVAWPYANGELHLGHVAGSILPADIFNRFCTINGDETIMVSGSDQYGTPITVIADKEGMTPAEVADKYHNLQKEALNALGIEYTLFTKTHTDNHTEVVQCMFKTLLDKGHMYVKDTDQYFCPSCKKFLPDRYVEGDCPKCGATGVRSDQCDTCGAVFETGDLSNAHCIHCNTPPEIRSTGHFFLRLSSFEGRLKEMMASKGFWRSNVKSFTDNWIEGGLKDRAVTRDMSWGVPVPLEGWDDKVIYVWFDAVIGYLSTSILHSRNIGEPDLWKDYWLNPEARHYYFIGKDNIPFHSIIWPSMLMGAGDYNLPYDIPANEYLLFKGGKFSKSRGGAIYVKDAIEASYPDAIRYYLSITMPDSHDTEFSWEDFQAKVNSELVSALGNFYHRCLSFTHRNFGSIPAGTNDPEVTDAIEEALEQYRLFMGACEFKRGIKSVMDLSRFGNRYFDSKKPWSLIKTDRDECGSVMNNLLRLVKALSTMAFPFMPDSSKRIWDWLGMDVEIRLMEARSDMPVGQSLKEPLPVFAKVEIKVEEDEASFSAFKRLDIRTGRIVSVGDHPDAEKLYLLNVDVGEGSPRQIVAGLKAFYTKEEMLDRDVLVLCNLKPAKLRGLMSNGMLLAADEEEIGGKRVLLLKPSLQRPLGTRMACGFESDRPIIEYKEFQKVKMNVKVKNEDIAKMSDSDSRFLVLVSDEGDAILLSDGDGCHATVDSEMMDGANVR